MAPWSFTVACPNGHVEAQEGFDKETLRALLKRNTPIQLHCTRCDTRWDATELQRSSIEFALAKGH